MATIRRGMMRGGTDTHHGRVAPGESCHHRRWDIDALSLQGVDRLQLARRVHQLLGHAWQRDGRPVTERDVQIAIAQQSPIMRGLDLIDDTDRQAWTVGASARSLLPHAGMLAEIWTNDE